MDVGRRTSTRKRSFAASRDDGSSIDRLSKKGAVKKNIDLPIIIKMPERSVIGGSMQRYALLVDALFLLRKEEWV